LTQMRQGTECDKALMMACMFRAVIHETTDEVKAKFEQQIVKQNKGSSQVIKKLVSYAETRDELEELLEDPMNENDLDMIDDKEYIIEEGQDQRSQDREMDGDAE